ncbi:MAG: hypothetical protein KDA28_09405 [Phycisphaerales bacterium]|nr:hypothetical protein [Phycisphaerales bacterium]
MYATFSIYNCSDVVIENNISLDYGVPETRMRFGGDFYSPQNVEVWPEGNQRNQWVWLRSRADLELAQGSRVADSRSREADLANQVALGDRTRPDRSQRAHEPSVGTVCATRHHERGRHVH